MFARIFALLPLAVLVAAEYQCNTGSPNCCNTAGPYNSPAVQSKINSLGLGAIGSLLADVTAVVGLQCTGIAGTGSDCSQTPVCCENNESYALVNVQCSPITIL